MDMQPLYEVEINGISHDGKGVGRINDKVIFIEKAVPGEIVLTKITKEKKSFYEGLVVNVLTASPDRVNIDCPVFESCAGCSYRHVTYQREVKLKTQIVRETLKRIAGVDENLIGECLPSPRSESYRNKIQYHVKVVEGKTRLGFIDKDFRFFPFLGCCLADKSMTDWARVIEQQLPAGTSRVIIRRAHPSGQLLCLLVASSKIAIDASSINNIMNFSGATALFLNISHPKAPDILGGKTYKIAGEDYLQEAINDLIFAVGPTSFFQVNPYQTPHLFEHAVSFLADKEKNILDLYCGVGSISLSAAFKTHHITGVEISEEAIMYAKKNAALNDIDNTEFYVGDVDNADVFLQGSYSAVIVDPPRRGCTKEALLKIAQITDKIVYVSCESSTLARDIKILMVEGFAVKAVIPVDMFSRTAHCESVALLQKTSNFTEK